MIGEILANKESEEKARVLTEPFPHLLGGHEEAPDQVVLVAYKSGGSAGNIEIVPVNQLTLHWEIVPKGKAGVF